MTEEFVTLETAKLLKEKGFDETCEYCILDQDDDVIGASRGCIINEKIVRHKNIKNAIPITSLYQAQKWLRETKNLHICVYNCACGYGYEISKADNGTHITSSTYEGTNDGGEWDTYEEALEAGLQEALKLI
nr:MAG TPA: hypothetical protein [Caudoviricetes sp.]